MLFILFEVRSELCELLNINYRRNKRRYFLLDPV